METFRVRRFYSRPGPRLRHRRRCANRLRRHSHQPSRTSLRPSLGRRRRARRHCYRTTECAEPHECGCRTARRSTCRGLGHTFIEGRRRKYHNGDTVEIFYQPHAITDSDSFMLFRRADVIATGDIFTTTEYPFIDTKAGGAVQGSFPVTGEFAMSTRSPSTAT